MKNELIKKFMEVFSLEKEDAEIWVELHIARICEHNPACNETLAIHSTLNTL